MPQPEIVKKGPWQTVVTNGGSNGKFLGVLDLQIKGKRVTDFRYTLLPVFSQLLPADREMAALITKLRAPHEAQLKEVLATTDGTLYRRGNFNGSWDQLLLDALMQTQDAPIAFSPGFRWGTSLLPGAAITREHLMDQTATTYSYATLNDISGAQIKVILEDVADNLFNPDPYYQQGGDMVRVGGLTYAIDPNAAMGARISDLRLAGQPLEADKLYKVAGWAPVAEGARTSGLKPVWELVEPWLKAQKVIRPRAVNTPRLIGTLGNPGLA
jgi:sulfur-oxidizing protein SoxB